MFWQFFGCGSWPGKEWRMWLKGGTKGGWGGGGRRTWRVDPDWLFYCTHPFLVWHLFILYSWFAAAAPPDADWGTRTYSRTHTGHGRHRCDFFIIRKELGKGGRGSGIIRVPGYFLFFSGPETGGDSGDNFLVPDLGPFLVPDPGLFLFCTSHFYILKKDYITWGRGGVLRLKR